MMLDHLLGMNQHLEFPDDAMDHALTRDHLRRWADAHMVNKPTARDLEISTFEKGDHTPQHMKAKVAAIQLPLWLGELQKCVPPARRLHFMGDFESYFRREGHKLSAYQLRAKACECANFHGADAAPDMLAALIAFHDARAPR